MKKLKTITFLSITFGLLLVFSYFAYVNYKLSVINKTKVLTYETIDKSTYEVYYMDTKLVSGKSNGESFIKKYINNIKINFDYKMNFSDTVNINNNYLIKSTLVVYSPDESSELWRSKSDYLLKETSKENKNVNRNNNKYTVNIDYQKYVNLYEEFKQDTNIYSNAKILVEFMNNSNINYNTLKTIYKNDITSFDIPVVDSTIIINKNTTATGIKYTKIDNNKVVKREMKYLGLFFLYLILDILCLIIIISIIIKYLKERNEYHNKLKRILKDYNSIIINIKKLPKLNDKKIVEVTHFSELIDVELELRKPINFIETKENKESWFLIITSDIIWVYKLIKKKGDKNEKKK